MPHTHQCVGTLLKCNRLAGVAYQPLRDRRPRRTLAPALRPRLSFTLGRIARGFLTGCRKAATARPSAWKRWGKR